MSKTHKIKLGIALFMTAVLFFFDIWVQFGSAVVRPGVLIVSVLLVGIITDIDKQLKKKNR